MTWIPEDFVTDEVKKKARKDAAKGFVVFGALCFLALFIVAFVAFFPGGAALIFLSFLVWLFWRTGVKVSIEKQYHDKYNR